jgi:hypothetical protein
MASYLEDYGETQARHSRKLRWLILTPIIVVIVGTALYFQFRDYPQYRSAKHFLELLQAKDYKGAYALWGCTDQKPCPQYSFDTFMKDWGPQSTEFRNPDQARISDTRGCKSGVINTVRTSDQKDILLWVDRSTGEIGFAPWQLKQIPPGFRTQLAAWMWSVTRNCDPLIGP